LIDGSVIAPTAESLMRSRYSAYVVHAIDYLGETLHPDHRGDWDRDATRKWAESSEWLGLTIVSTESGGEGDDEGWVEFNAIFRSGGEEQQHTERSRFRRHQGRWYYVDGDLPKPRTQRHETPKVGRNDPCPCGSGRKYKKCCGA
jgi:SEC-C motif-containing protein